MNILYFVKIILNNLKNKQFKIIFESKLKFYKNNNFIYLKTFIIIIVKKNQINKNINIIIIQN